MLFFGYRPQEPSRISLLACSCVWVLLPTFCQVSYWIRISMDESRHTPMCAGVLMDRSELERASQLCQDAGAWLVMDNTYEHFAYDGREHTCISGSHILHIFSFSKVCRPIDNYSKSITHRGYQTYRPAPARSTICTSILMRSANWHTVAAVLLSSPAVPGGMFKPMVMPSALAKLGQVTHDLSHCQTSNSSMIKLRLACPLADCLWWHSLHVVDKQATSVANYITVNPSIVRLSELTWKT